MPSVTEPGLSSPYRPVRPVPAGPEAPWSGLIVRLASGGSGLLVDARGFPDDWSGWDAEAGGHLVAPSDLIRRADGHDVLLELFGGRIEDVFQRRRSARATIDAGEAVTVAVSMLRGLAALGANARAVRGEWWLTESGRPVIATECGESSVLDASAHLLDQLAPVLGSTPSEELRAAFDRSRWHTTEVERLEGILFALAAPAPLAAMPLAPRSARSFATAPADDDPYEVPAVDDGGSGWVGHLARHVDADVADLVSRATTGVWRRLRTPRTHSQKRPWIVGGLLAAGILTVGVLWPGGGPATADPAPDATSLTVDHEPTDADRRSSPPSPEPSASDALQDLAAIAMALLTERLDCASDASCLATVMTDPAAVVPTGAIDLSAEQRTAELVDEFGGAAVIRIASVTGEIAAQLVVIESDGHRWLLRDVYDAQQPDE